MTNESIRENAYQWILGSYWLISIYLLPGTLVYSVSTTLLSPALMNGEVVHYPCQKRCMLAYNYTRFRNLKRFSI